MYLCAKLKTIYGFTSFSTSKNHIYSQRNCGQDWEPKRSDNFAHSFAKKGYVSKIRRGLYCVNNIAKKQPEANKFQIASSINPSSFVAYHAAMEYHGLSHQTYYDVTIGTTNYFNSFDFDGYHYYSHVMPLNFAIENPIADSLVRVTSVERTIIDCIDRIDLCGGWEELANCLQSVSYIREDQLLTLLQSYDKTALYKKTGFLLETLHVPVSLDFINKCKVYARNSVCRLTSDGDSDHFCQSWRIYVPSELLNKVLPLFELVIYT